ncbi:MAG TPA: DegV family protein [Patescibacteria group bacterium]|nr:DegV family protein [Patescibacteria group bacterium]
MTIRIVTDSVCDIPKATSEAFGITVVPAYVNIGDESYLDGVDLSRRQFYEGLPHYSTAPTTAAPAPGAFTEVYDRLAAEGAGQILSIHVSSSLSGILNAARLGSEATDSVEVQLFDSQQLTMGLGLLAITAAEGAIAGQTMNEIVATLNKRVERTYVIGLLDTLEYLRRSGRVNWATFGLGTLLHIKPLLRVHKSEVTMLEKVRTSKRALIRFLELAGELGPLENIALLHTHVSQQCIQEFQQQTRFLVPEGIEPLIVELTPALGAHLGPNGLGIACITRNNIT